MRRGRAPRPVGGAFFANKEQVSVAISPWWCSGPLHDFSCGPLAARALVSPPTGVAGAFGSLLPEFAYAPVFGAAQGVGGLPGHVSGISGRRMPRSPHSRTHESHRPRHVDRRLGVRCYPITRRARWERTTGVQNNLVPGIWRRFPKFVLASHRLCSRHNSFAGHTYGARLQKVALPAWLVAPFVRPSLSPHSASWAFTFAF